jgi:O-antigen/teichoic acid export membrane protein
MDTEIIKEKPLLLNQRFVQDTLRYLPVAVLPAILALVAGSIYTRIYSPLAYGIYSFALAFTVPLTTFFTEWAGQPAGRFYSEYEGTEQKRLYDQFVVTAIFVTVLALVVVSVITICILVFIYGQLPNPLVFFGAIASILSLCLTNIALAILPASFRSTPYRLVIIGSSTLSIAFSMIMVRFLGADAAWLFWGQFFANCLFIPYIYRKANIRINCLSFKLTPEMISVVRRFWKYGSPMMVWFTVINFLNTGDRLVLQLFKSSAEVGIYSVNYSLVAGIVGLLNVPIGLAVGPLLYRQWKDGKPHHTEKTIVQMTELYIILAFLVYAGMLVTGSSMVSILLGEKFRSGVIIFPPVLLGRMLWGVSVIGQKSLELNEKTSYIVKNSFVTMVLNFLLNLFLIPTYGYIAAAYTTLVCYLVYAALIWWDARRYIPWRVETIHYLPYLLAFGVSFLAGHLVVMSVTGNLLQILFGGLTILIVYCGLVYLLAGTRIKNLIRFDQKALDELQA